MWKIKVFYLNTVVDNKGSEMLFIHNQYEKFKGLHQYLEPKVGSQNEKSSKIEIDYKRWNNVGAFSAAHKCTVRLNKHFRNLNFKDASDQILTTKYYKKPPHISQVSIYLSIIQIYLQYKFTQHSPCM